LDDLRDLPELSLDNRSDIDTEANPIKDNIKGNCMDMNLDLIYENKVRTLPPLSHVKTAMQATAFQNKAGWMDGRTDGRTD